jgi:hypothetical protein
LIRCDLTEALGEDHNGECSVDNLTMRVRASLQDSKRIEIFLHEVLHFLVSEVTFPSEEVEESVVSVLGQRLVGFFRDNPECVRSIANCLQEESDARSSRTR